MRILPRYIVRQTIVTLLLTLSVITFVLLVAGMMRRLSEMVINQQLGLGAVAWFFLLTTPYILSFALPMAMRASGIGLGQIAAPVILVGLLASGVCFYTNASLAPTCRYQLKSLFLQMGMDRPMALLEEGTYMKDFAGYVIYVGRKTQDEIHDVVIYMLDDKGNVTSSLRAQRGLVTVRRDTQTLLMDLYDVRGDLRDASDPTNLRKIRPGTTARRYPLELDLGRVLHRGRTLKKLGDYTLLELRQEIRELQAKGIYPSAALMEAHGRVAMAVACVAFTLLGIPLGLKTSRRETTIGIAFSLILAFVYYFVVILANALKEKPGFFPAAMSCRATCPPVVPLEPVTRIMDASFGRSPRPTRDQDARSTISLTVATAAGPPRTPGSRPGRARNRPGPGPARHAGARRTRDCTTLPPTRGAASWSTRTRQWLGQSSPWP